MTGVSIKDLSVSRPVSRSAWQAIYEADPDSLVTQSPDWVDCICASDRYRDASVLFEAGDGRRLLLPFVEHRWMPSRIGIAASLPGYWEAGGPIGDGARDPEMLQAAMDFLASEPRFRFSVRPNAIHAPAWQQLRANGYVKVAYTDQSIDLEGGFEAVAKRCFRSSVKRGVKKALASDIKIEHATGEELVPVFYDLYEKSIIRWAEQQREPLALSKWRARLRDPRRKLDAIARKMGERCHIWVARHQGQPAAAIIVLQEQNAQYIRGAMDKDVAGRIGANFLLHYKAIEEACRTGCRHYHMGESRAGSPLAHFKAHFGAELIDYEEYRHERLPVTRADRWLRETVKMLIGFKDY